MVIYIIVGLLSEKLLVDRRKVVILDAIVADCLVLFILIYFDVF